MPFINRFFVDDTTGRVAVSSTVPLATDPFLVGLSYNAAQALAVVVAIPSSLDYVSAAGVAGTNNGALYTRVDDPPPVNERNYNGGLLLDKNGALCMTITNPIAGYVRGCPVDAIGQVCRKLR